MFIINSYNIFKNRDDDKNKLREYNVIWQARIIYESVHNFIHSIPTTAIKAIA